MSRDTIIGDAPSGTLPGPDSVVPGEERTDRDTEEPTSDHAAIDADKTTRPDVPGDATTAFHRSRVYSLLALGFERPGDDFQRAIEADAFPTDLVESSEVIDDDVADIALTVGTYVDDADILHDEWASLFGVEEGVTVSPYELTYLPGPLMTNVRKLADLSGFYDAFGLEIVPEKNDRRDHVCFLLEFLGQLSLREAYLRLEDDEGVAIVVDAYRQFLEDHLGRWYWRFADEVSQHDDGFYATLGDLLAALVETEIDRFHLDPELVPDDPRVTEWTEDVFGESGRSCGGCGIDTHGIDGRNSTVSDPDATETTTERDFEG
jgi:DMSO reductase family type II enzyme chaperone